jgi:hypothetical protein
MAKGLDNQELRRLAQIGAQARLAELDSERASLLRVFPGLRRTHAQSDGSPSRTAATKSRRRRSNMSAANRKAVSERMKKYWANRRAAGQKRKSS